MLVSIFAHLAATLSLFPLLSFVFIYFLIYLWTKNKPDALHWAMNVTTILVLLSIFITVQHLWGVSIHWLLATIVLLIAMILTYLQYVIRGEIQLSRLGKGIIRLIFLLLVPVHIILYVWGVIRAVILASN